MENFIVSARKYRPSTFKEVVGQESITRTLKNAILSDHLAQAFLFTGPRGVGKTTCARILAKTINCLNITEDTEPCNECESCTSFNTSGSFNIHELDAASNNSVDDIRSLVDQVRIPPQDGKYKVYIIDEVHMLSSAAYNAFLKTLEEPPAYAKFILATTEKHKIIPTVLSRCQAYDFQRIRVEDIRSHLQWVAETEGIEAETEALQVIAQKADGALRDALSIFDQINAFSAGSISYKATIENLNVLDYEYYFKGTELLLKADIPGILNLVEDVISRGFDGHHFMNGLGAHLRNLLMCRDPQTIPLLEVSESVRESYARQAAQCETPFLIKALHLQSKCDLDYKNSSNKRLLIELALLQMLQADASEGNSTPAAISSGAKKKTEALSPPRAAEEKEEPAKESIATSEPSTQKPTPQVSVQPKPNPPQAKPGNGSRSSRTPSIREALASKSAEAKNEPEIDPDQRSEDPKTNFDTSAFMEIWADWVDDVSTELPSLASNLRISQPQIGVDATITVTLENVVQEENLKTVRGELQELLRNKLNNPDILILTKVEQSTQIDRKPFTSKERYEAMMAKNSLLKDLREDLDLDID